MALSARILLLIALFVAIPYGVVAAQDDRADAVAAAAIEISQLERSGDLLLLHDRLHPDVRLVVSRAELKAWYEGPDAVTPTADPEILSVSFGIWTWPVTGKSYAEVATVELRQPGTRQGVEVEQTEIQHYWFDGAHWRWFVEADLAFIQTLSQQIHQDAAPSRAFPELDNARIDQVWQETYAEAGGEYRPPDDINVFRQNELPLQSSCGPLTLDDEAFYCVLDQEVYYLLEFREQVEQQVGGYGWTSIVSHEWGHHIQFLEGIKVTMRPELDDGFYSIEVELQADCLAGVYAQEAVARGWITEVDLNDAYQIAIFFGDLPDTPFDDPHAHGTGTERLKAFTRGLEDGVFGCNLMLGPKG